MITKRGFILRGSCFCEKYSTATFSTADLMRSTAGYAQLLLLYYYNYIIINAAKMTARKHSRGTL